MQLDIHRCHIVESATQTRLKVTECNERILLVFEGLDVPEINTGKGLITSA